MLSDKEIKGLEPREAVYRVYDVSGLYLLVTPAGGKLWRMDYTLEKKRKTACLGKYPALSLKDARLKRDELRLALADGVDIAKSKKIAAPKTTQTFEYAAREWCDSRRNGWTAHHAAAVLQSLADYAFPFLGDKHPSAITPPMVLACVRALESKGVFETARRLFQRIRAVFAFAIACGYCERNPALDIAGALHAVPAAKNLPALPLSLLHDFLNDMAACNSEQGLKNMIMMQILTFCRPTEVRLMSWAEVDLNAGMWRVPAERMKSRREHIVPLTNLMREVLKMQDRVRCENNDFVFNSKYNNAFSDAAVNKLLERMDLRGIATGHGFRAMASTALNECGKFDSDVIEAQLAHVPENKVRSAYNRAKYLDQRMALLEAWSDFIARVKLDKNAIL